MDHKRLTGNVGHVHAHEEFLESGVLAGSLRGLVAQSWLRSAAAGVDAETNLAPLGMARDDLLTYRAAHPLARVFPLLYDVLGRAAEDCESVMAVGDAQGQLLWVCGRPAELRRAERIHFAEGAVWDEQHAGTNAPGTALRLDSAVQIHAAEHFNRLVQPWSCAAAPIHDPQTGQILGLVDVTGGEAVSSPQTLGMVRAAARMAEAELARIVAVEFHSRATRRSSRRPSSATSPTSPTNAAAGASGLDGVRSRPAPTESAPVLSLEALGVPRATLRQDGEVRPLALTPRHREILVLLSEHPDGMTGDQLAIELYDNDTHSSTLRAEIARLRSLLGEQALQSRPYRLDCLLECDWQAMRAQLFAGRVRDAFTLYRSPLLPLSEAPGVVELREALHRQLRAAILQRPEAELAVAWTRTRWGAADLEMWQRQAELLPPSSPLIPLALAEAERLEIALIAGT